MAWQEAHKVLLLTFHSEATQYDDPLSRVDRRRDDAARHGQRWEGIMQFHLNGFEPGDPEIFDRSERFERMYLFDVRFTPQSRHRLSALGYPLGVKA